MESGERVEPCLGSNTVTNNKNMECRNYGPKSKSHGLVFVGDEGETIWLGEYVITISNSPVIDQMDKENDPWSESNL